MALTGDQENFRDMVSRFMQDKCGAVAVRQLLDSDTGFDADVWAQMTAELGLAGTHIEEAYGGFGFGPIELGIAAEQMGRHLYCGPFLASSVMSGYALSFLADEAAKEALLPGIATGTTIAALVLDDLNEPSRVGQAITVKDGQLQGSAAIVIDAQNAAELLVVAGEADGRGFYRVSTGDAAVTVTPRQSLDPTRRLASVDFAGVTAERIGSVSAAGLRNVWDHVCVALAHEMIGGAQQLFESTIDYTKVRFQFGRPIGSFQGLKHRCADLLMELEFARAATHHAAACLAGLAKDEHAASMAKAMASDVYMEAGRAAIQLRGGIGFTWEEDTHFWFKRAKSSEVLLGSPDIHRERMMTIMEAAS